MSKQTTISKTINNFNGNRLFFYKNVKKGIKLIKYIFYLVFRYLCGSFGLIIDCLRSSHSFTKMTKLSCHSQSLLRNALFHNFQRYDTPFIKILFLHPINTFLRILNHVASSPTRKLDIVKKNDCGANLKCKDSPLCCWRTGS